MVSYQRVLGLGFLLLFKMERDMNIMPRKDQLKSL